MQLIELELTNFLCFDSLKLEPGERKLNVFVGRNGRGKSAIRDAIAFLLVGLYWSDDVAIFKTGQMIWRHSFGVERNRRGNFQNGGCRTGSTNTGSTGKSTTACLDI